MPESGAVSSRNHSFRLAHAVVTRVPLAIGVAWTGAVAREVSHGTVPRTWQGLAAVAAWMAFIVVFVVLTSGRSPSSISFPEDAVEVRFALGNRRRYARKDLYFDRAPNGRISARAACRGAIRRWWRGFSFHVETLRDPRAFLRQIGQ